MPLDVAQGQPMKFPDPTFLTLDNFKRGVITLIDQSKLPKNALRELTNMYLTEDGAPTTRPGIDWYGTAAISQVRATTFTQTTNLITNPSFETNTTSWSGTNCTLSTVSNTGLGGVGTSCLLMTHTTGSQCHANYTASGLTIGQTYTLQFRIARQTTGSSVGVGLSLGALYSGSTTISGVILSTSFQLITFSFVAEATSGVISISNNGATSPNLLLDAVQLEANSNATDYFDGSFSNTTSTDYAWTGTAHGSTATRKVYDMLNASIDGFDYFDFNGVLHLVVAMAGNIYRSIDDGATWTVCTNGTYTSGKYVNMNQYNAGLYLTTGVDATLIYDGSTTLIKYATLSTPAAPTVAKTGLASTSYTYYYKIAIVNKIGYSAASPAGSIQVSLPRSSWDSTTNFVTLTLPTPATNQERADIYLSEDNVNFYYIDSVISSTTVPNVTYRDEGKAFIVPSTIAPTVNTTSGPSAEELTNIGSRMFGVRDPNNRYRIWYSSGSPPYGAFSGAYDGGYFDWSPGGKYYPVKAEDYRDKSGAPIATIWCDSADGEGCILQMSLDLTTVGNVSVTTPSAYKLAGSRGTSAPYSVVNVLNDYMYYNSQAFYNLGSRAQFLNLLSTDESSANIRNTVRTINAKYAKGICAVFYDAKVFFSVPYGDATSNSHTIVYDTEQKAWIPTAFTVGFKKFVRYTSVDGKHRLLAVKQGDSRLSEITTDLATDYGNAFETTLLTGLYPVNPKNRFGFQDTDTGYCEFSNAQGTLNIDIVGIERTSGYSTVKSYHFTNEATVQNTGWDTFDWDSKPWDDTSKPITTYSESSTKRYFNIQKELNAVQWRITTNTPARYVLRTLQTEGTDTQSGPPRQWRIKN